MAYGVLVRSRNLTGPESERIVLEKNCQYAGQWRVELGGGDLIAKMEPAF